ncbi:GTP 3',8-cyclase MoaA [Alcaligenaceae bacterium 429]|nr:GTP 3',8-cyclase MoaA [Alcaligenaceae bacterium 429]
MNKSLTQINQHITSMTNSSPKQASPRVIPLAESGVRDQLGRPLHDLRISVTDKCNFRCTYCMPREIFGPEHEFLAQKQLLSFEEITRVAELAVRMGVRKIRLTGGEPLLRRRVEDLVHMLAQLRTVEGKPVELAMTTNGTLLAAKARDLKQAGLNRVTVSLDALEDARFTHLSDSKVSVRQVLDGIEKASAEGLFPVKVNMVVRKGLNGDQIVPMAEYFRNTPHILRFIEYMDVGNSNGWNMKEVITGAEIVSRIHEHYPLEPVQANYTGEVAGRYRYLDGAGEVGMITSVSQPFCGDCSRIRLSPEGRLFLCLFASQGVDMRGPLRAGATDDALAGLLAGTWRARKDRYSEVRGEVGHKAEKVEMSYIGG